MRRKFSLASIPLLNIVPSRLDNKQLRDHLLSHVDSRPPTPRSVRPPLPTDIDTELRAACTYIVTHPKPSHEFWTTEASKPAPDYVAVKQNGDYFIEDAPGEPNMRSRSAAPEDDTAGESSKYSYRPGVATEDLFALQEQERIHIHARTRADQLMAPDPVKVVTVTRTTQSKLPPGPLDQQQVATKSDAPEKTRTSARSDSVGTTGSTPHTDATDYPWSASTAMTSAVITPARGSKRASSQYVASVPDSGSMPRTQHVDADWMLAELERHKKLMEEREREKERETGAAQQIMNTIPAEAASHAPTLLARVPSRKPVPSRPESRQAKEIHQVDGRQVRQTNTDRGHPPPSSRGRSESSRPVAERNASGPDGESRGRGVNRSRSRVARAASRAASRVESITNDIMTHYVKPQSAQNVRRQESTMERRRSPSRVMHISTQIKDYIKPSRPETSMSNRKPSIDTAHRHVRAGSSDSLHSSMSKSNSAEGASRWRSWQPFGRVRSRATTPDLSRPGSSESAMRGCNVPTDQDDRLRSAKPQVDLNRELPPLPGLDQWKAEEDQPQQSLPVRDVSTTQTQYPGFKRALSRRHQDIFTPPQQDARNSIGAAHSGSANKMDPQKSAVARRPEPDHPPSNSAVATSPNGRAPDSGQQHIPRGRSTEPHVYAAPVDAQPARSMSSMSNRPMPPVERKTSSSSRPSLHLFPVSRSATAVPATSKRRAEMRHGFTASSEAVNPVYTGARTGDGKFDSIRKYSADDYHHQYTDLPIAPHHQANDKEEPRHRWWQTKDSQQYAKRRSRVLQLGDRNSLLLLDPEDEDAAGSPVIRF